MGTEAHQVKVFLVWFTVDQDEVGPDMTIAMIGPLAAERMVDIFRRQLYIISQEVDNFHKGSIEYFPMPPCFFPFIVTFEAGRIPNLPH